MAAVNVARPPLTLTVAEPSGEDALPQASKATVAKPRYVCPSALPEWSRPAFAKNSTRNVVLAALASVPVMAVLPGVTTAEVSTGAA